MAAANNNVKRTARSLNPSLISRPSGSKDRHTMVLTSKGARDRRMRLSVGTAIKLYCIQDMLGFEQPSQAVEWLLEKSQAAIRELPQRASISSSHLLSQYVDCIKADDSLSCPQTGDLSTSSQDNASNANGECLVNLYQQTLAAKSCKGQKSSTAMNAESNNKVSMVHGKEKERRSLALSSLSSNCRTGERANVVPAKELRAKARERARERATQKDKSYSQQNGICGMLQPSSVSPWTPTFWTPTFCLQDNTSSASSLNMINTNTEGSSNSSGFINSLMFTKDSILDSQSRLCICTPPTEISQGSSPASIHYYTPQLEGSSFQSTEALSRLYSGTFHLPSDTFPKAVATTSSSEGVFCTYPLDDPHFQSSNLGRCCKIHSTETPCIFDGAVETLYEIQNSSENVFLQFR